MEHIFCQEHFMVSPWKRVERADVVPRPFLANCFPPKSFIPVVAVGCFPIISRAPRTHRVRRIVEAPRQMVSTSLRRQVALMPCPHEVKHPQIRMKHAILISQLSLFCEMRSQLIENFVASFKPSICCFVGFVGYAAPKEISVPGSVRMW